MLNWNMLKAVLAQATPGRPQGPYETMTPIVMMVVLFVVMYLVMIRPQRQRQKQLEVLIKSVKGGDKIITSSGLVGVVISVKDKTLTLRTADTKIEILKSTVAEVTEKGGESSSES